MNEKVSPVAPRLPWLKAVPFKGPKNGQRNGRGIRGTGAVDPCPRARVAALELCFSLFLRQVYGGVVQYRRYGIELKTHPFADKVFEYQTG